MAFKKFLGLTLVLGMALSMVACSSETATEDTTAATVAETTVAETTEAAEETTEAIEESVEETVVEVVETVNGIRYNVDGSVDFEEPVLYEVIEEVDAYTDWQANSIALTYPVGSCISAISTDGYYVMQDNGYIIEVAALQIME